jgi:hypothetical protein
MKIRITKFQCKMLMEEQKVLYITLLQSVLGKP